VLIVDDDESSRTVLATAVQGFGYPVRVAHHGDDALAECERRPAAIVMTDWSMPGMTGLELCVAFAYGGRWDIAQACRSLAREVAAGTLRPDEIDEAHIAARLALAGIPDPDLLIRTGGELRVSNFLLWNLAYAELYFTDVLFPDFGAAELDAALHFFAQRERRFGKTSAQIGLKADA